LSTHNALAAAHAEVKSEIARTDTKASLLLAFNGALLAGAWSVATGMDLPLTSLIIGGAGSAVLVAAAGVLLSTVRPNLGGRHGFPLWATLTAEEISAHLAQDRLAQDIEGLSRLAVSKFARLRRAIDLTRLAGGLFIAAVLIAAICTALSCITGRA
jgi:hypothetical protein